MYHIKLSPYGKIFYVEWLLNPLSYRYNVVFDQIFYGNLDVERLKKTIDRYVAHHLLLNSHIEEIEGEPYWVPNVVAPPEINVDLECSSPNLLDEVCFPFNLHLGPLCRFKLLKVNHNAHRLIMVFHHIVLDGLSLQKGFFQELSHYYNDEHYMTEYSLDRQREELIQLEEKLSCDLAKNLKYHDAFWKKQLCELEKIDLSFLKSPKISYLHFKNKNPIQEIRFDYDLETLKKLNQLYEMYGVTSYIYGLSVFALLLNKYTNQDDFSVSFPFLIQEGHSFFYGAQLNTNLIPFHLKEVNDITELFAHCKKFLKELKCGKKHGYYPIFNIAQDSDKNLLNASFIQTDFRDTPFQFQGIEKVEILSELHVDSVPESMLLFEQQKKADKLCYRVRFCEASFSGELMQQFVSCYQRFFITILQDLIHSKVKNKKEYLLLDKEEYEKIVYGLNEKVLMDKENRTIVQWFEDAALENSNRIALSYEGKELNYEEFNGRINQWAHYLKRECSIQSEDFVAICLDKTEELVILIMAVLKTGAAYVPIDINSPSERNRYILEDSKAKILLTSKKYEKDFFSDEMNIILVDEDKIKNDISRESSSNLNLKISQENLAYIIYTSGTTGKPKGVLQQHVNVVHLFSATQDFYQFNSKDVWVLFHSYVFDFSVWEMFGAFFWGGKLIIPSKEQIQDLRLFYRLCYEEKVTVLNQTPKVFYQLIDIATKEIFSSPLLNLRYIVFGGDILIFKNLQGWFNCYPYEKPKLVNMYGTTETTVHTTYKLITEEDLDGPSYIGKQIIDQTLYVLDRDLNPLPMGAIGELYVGGGRLSKGYLNRPELTTERFIQNPFLPQVAEGNVKDHLLYKTGDLVRRVSVSDIEYIGRNDFQVKIRGYRIELGEIENVFLEHQDIKQAIILLMEDEKNPYLTAYYVAGREIPEQALLDYLISKLPDYMRPRFIIFLEKLPLTVNGKLDKNALPVPVKTQRSNYIAPRTEAEKLICDAFSKILKIDSVGVDDDFFNRHGDSLSAIQLTALLQTNFSVKVSDIFDFRTPRNIAKNVSFAKNKLLETLEKIKKVFSKEKVVKFIDAEKLKQYFSSFNNFRINKDLLKNISNVLLTGATGYLGCNLLNQLLEETHYNVYVVIRSENEKDAWARLKENFFFYFEKDLEPFHESRIFVISADLEEAFLGLSVNEYLELTKKIDSIIHAAALVKHYGEKETFYSANVKSTIHLLDFCKLTNLKDFHYISTSSVFELQENMGMIEKVYTEDDLPADIMEADHVYVSTKLQGERAVIEYRKQGVNGNIYRVGNLAFISDTYKLQKNIEENAFFNWFQCLLKLGCFSEDISLVEMSQVDLTAKAIIKIFDKPQLAKGIYHVFNPQTVDLDTFFKNNEFFPMKKVSTDIFIDDILAHLQNEEERELILKFLLRQGWLDGISLENRIIPKILELRTELILNQLGFYWKPIDKEMLYCYVHSVNSRYGYIQDEKNKRNSGVL